MIKHNVKQFSEFQNWLERPLNCLCERCWGIVRHCRAYCCLRNSGICLQQPQQSCSFIRLFFSCHLCSKHNFKLETVKSGSCSEVRGGQRKVEWENVRGATKKKKKAGSVFNLNGWQRTKSYNGGNESTGEKVQGRQDSRREPGRSRERRRDIFTWNEQTGGRRQEGWQTEVLC